MTVQKETFFNHTSYSHRWIVKNGDTIIGTFPTRIKARDFLRGIRLQSEQPLEAQS